jgi:hypothetical protein
MKKTQTIVSIFVSILVSANANAAPPTGGAPRDLQLQLSSENLAKVTPVKSAEEIKKEKEEANDPKYNNKIHWDAETQVKLGAAAVGGGLTLASMLMKPGTALIGTNPLDDAARNALKLRTESARTKADTVSTGMVVGLIVVPVVVDGIVMVVFVNHQGQVAAKMILNDAVSYLTVAGLDGVLKNVTARLRPCAEGPNPTCTDTDSHLSFASQHTATAVAMAYNFCSQHFDGSVSYGSKAADVAACGVMGGAALTVGYLRMAADKHNLTDVGVGALLGLAAGGMNGVLHDLLHHELRKSTSGSGNPQSTDRSSPSLALDVSPMVSEAKGVMVSGAF